MRHRLSAGVTAVGSTAIVATMLAWGAAPASGVTGDGWCAGSSPSPAPCVVAAYRGSVALSDGGAYDITVGNTSNSGAHSASFQFSQTAAAVNDPQGNPPGDYESLPSSDLGQQFSVTLRVGFDPRETDEYARDVAITKVPNADGTWDVTVTGNAVAQGVNAECTVSVSPWTCPATTGADITAFFGEISDFQQWNDSRQWVDFDGMDTRTNVEEVGIPPEISGDPLTITAQLANSQYLPGGQDQFEGFYDVVLPNQFLIDMGIDDPSTLDPAGIAAAIGSGKVTVTPGPTSTEVDVEDITFPATTGQIAKAIAAAGTSKQRELHIKRGTITPSRPKITKAKRGTHSAKLTFVKAHPRGSHLRSYEGRCTATHQTTRTARAKKSPIVVKRLTAGVAYKCQVRAKAKAGYGSWSNKRKLKR